MGQDHHEAGAVCAGVDLQLLRDADEAGEVAALVLDGVGKAGEAVELRAGAGGQGRRAGVVALRHPLGGGGGILAADDGDLRVLGQEGPALADGLLVGVDLPDVRELRPRLCQEVVVHLQPDGADDAEVVLLHEVVDGVDGAGGAVLQGDDAEAAEALLNGGEDGLEAGEVEDVGTAEEPVAGQLGVGPLHPLAGDAGALREELGGVRQRLLDGLRQGAGDAQEPGLAAAAQLKDGLVEGVRVVPEFLGGLLLQLPELGPLPPGVQHRDAVGLLPGGDLRRHLHPLEEEGEELVVNGVHFFPVILQFHACSFLRANSAS